VAEAIRRLRLGLRGVRRHGSRTGSAPGRLIVPVVAACLAAAILTACSEGSATSVEERGATIVESCRGHGGAIAFDDEAVVCRDQTAVEDRGARAVDACQAHGGVTAFDDDVVICRDQMVEEAEE
jgi:hypothetical protein